MLNGSDPPKPERALAEKSAAAQQDNAAALASIKSDVAQLSASPASVEGILKQVG